MKHDAYNQEGSPEEEKGESAEMERKELPEHELDAHHKTLMDAEAIKGNPHIMKQLTPHMMKKAGHMKKIMSIQGLKDKEKSID